MIEQCYWCAGRAERFGSDCLVCAATGIIAPNPRPYEITITIFADEVEPARQFLAKLEGSLVYSFLGSMDAADRAGAFLDELRSELDLVQVSLADLDMQFPEFPPRSRG